MDAREQFQAAEQLFDAAEIISRNPAAMQLRYQQTLLELGVNQNSTIVFPLPIDLIRPLADAAGAVGDGGASRQPRAAPIAHE
jgi:hypothetical protein